MQRLAASLLCSWYVQRMDELVQARSHAVTVTVFRSAETRVGSAYFCHTPDKTRDSKHLQHLSDPFGIEQAHKQHKHRAHETIEEAFLQSCCSIWHIQNHTDTVCHNKIPIRHSPGHVLALDSISVSMTVHIRYCMIL